MGGSRGYFRALLVCSVFAVTGCNGTSQFSGGLPNHDSSSSGGNPNSSPIPNPSPSPSPVPNPTPKPTAGPTPVGTPVTTPTPVGTPVPNPTPVSGSSANSWFNRIIGVNSPGGPNSIVSWYNFDTFPVQNRQVYFYPANLYDPNQVTTDCTEAADSYSGACSLKFTILKGFYQGEPGNIEINFSPDLSKTFGPGQEFYVQYRERIDPGMLSLNNYLPTNGQFTGFKLDIVTEGDTPTHVAGVCGNSPGELVTISNDNATAPIQYHNCGYSGGQYFPMQQGYQPFEYGPIASANFLDQNYSGLPHYSNEGIPIQDPVSFLFVGNEWLTVQRHVKIGTFNTPTSVVEEWFSHQGQASVLVTGASDAALVNDGTGLGRYGKINLLSYATGVTFNVNTAVWYDDLIVSTTRIPDPDVSTPNPPDTLSLSGLAKGTVTVDWRVNSQNGTSQDDTGFLVERCTGNPGTCFPAPQSGFVQIGTSSAGSSSYVDTTVTSGTTYSYRVRAKNPSGNSAYAAAMCFNSSGTCGGTVVAP